MMISVGRRCEIWRHSEQYNITLVRRVTELKRRTMHMPFFNVPILRPSSVTPSYLLQSSKNRLVVERSPLIVYTNEKWSDQQRCTVSGLLDFADFTVRLRTPLWLNPQTVRRRSICGTVSTAWKPVRHESTKWTVTGLRVRVRTTTYQEKASSVGRFNRWRSYNTTALFFIIYNR